MEKIGMKYVGLDKEGGYAFRITKEEYCDAVKRIMLRNTS